MTASSAELISPIYPGTVETPSWEGRVNMAKDPVKARSEFIARQAMGRLAQPEEIASLATYLASDESDFVTGTLNLMIKTRTRGSY